MNSTPATEASAAMPQLGATVSGGIPAPPSPTPSAGSGQGLSEATAVRLFNSVVATTTQYGPSGGLTPLPAPVRPSTTAPIAQTTSAASLKQSSQNVVDLVKSMESVQSLNSCRICRYSRSDYQMLEFPCLCKGSVGYVHLQCLKRWILLRRDNHCEICHSVFHIPEEKTSISRMFKSFMTVRCCGAIVKHILSSASLAPLAHVVLHQLLFCMDTINESSEDMLTAREVLLCSCALLTSSALFFHFFEFVATRMLIIRNILRQWWMFGNTPDFAVVDVDDMEQFEFI